MYRQRVTFRAMVCAGFSREISGFFTSLHAAILAILHFAAVVIVKSRGGQQDEVSAGCCAGNPPG